MPIQSEFTLTQLEVWIGIYFLFLTQPELRKG